MKIPGHPRVINTSLDTSVIFQVAHAYRAMLFNELLGKYYR